MAHIWIAPLFQIGPQQRRRHENKRGEQVGFDFHASPAVAGQNHTPEQEAEGGGSGGDDHGHDHQVTIIVNARAKTWTEKDISFEQVVKLAFPTPPPGENIVYTVTYRKGEGHKPEGTLTQGESVKVKDGMIFNVTATDKS
jgi:Multiubiquitin